MTRVLIVFLLPVILISCGKKQPGEILSVNQMQAIQWDLMRADELVDYYRISDSLYPVEQRRLTYYDKVFSLHHTNKAVFTKSLNYYTARPAELKQIIEGVQSKGEKQLRQDSAKGKKDTASLKKDSVKMPSAPLPLKRKKGLKIKP